MRVKRNDSTIRTVSPSRTQALVAAKKSATLAKRKSAVVQDADDEDDVYVPKSSALKKPALKNIRDDLESDPDDDLAVRTKKVEDTSNIIQRTHSILERMDAERTLNGLGEDSTYEFYRASLLDTLELLPIARRSYIRYTSQSNAYAYNALVTKCQELLADMQALSDKSNVLERVLSRHIQPCFANIIANMANAYVLMDSEIKTMGLSASDTARVQAQLKSFTRGLGLFLQDSQNMITKELQGEFGEKD